MIFQFCDFSILWIFYFVNFQFCEFSILLSLGVFDNRVLRSEKHFQSCLNTVLFNVAKVLANIFNFLTPFHLFVTTQKCFLVVLGFFLVVLDRICGYLLRRNFSAFFRTTNKRFKWLVNETEFMTMVGSIGQLRNPRQIWFTIKVSLVMVWVGKFMF